MSPFNVCCCAGSTFADPTCVRPRRGLQPSMSRPHTIQKKQLQDAAFEAGETGFITAMAYMPKPDLYAAACLDRTLRLYKYRFRLQSVMHWDAGELT